MGLAIRRDPCARTQLSVHLIQDMVAHRILLEHPYTASMDAGDDRLPAIGPLQRNFLAEVLSFDEHLCRKIFIRCHPADDRS